MPKAKTNTQRDQASDLPAGLAAPARRALAGAGYTRLAQLAKVSEAEIKALHGIGPNALKVLRRALAGQGLAFAGEKRQPG
jgi:predicted flap endonuclease-1-like 5' DNA nuclease